MANAGSSLHDKIKLKKVNIPSYMTEKRIDNEYSFIKWQEGPMIFKPDRTSGCVNLSSSCRSFENAGTVYQVKLRVDSNGYYIYYENMNNEIEFIDTLTIKDARIGKYANTTKDSRIKAHILTLTGHNEININNYLTIVTGLDFINLNYINFYCVSTHLNEKWSSDILNISYNIFQFNNSAMSFLLKIYTKIILSVSSIDNNQLLTKKIVKTFTSNKEEKTKVKHALYSCGLPIGKNEFINVNIFKFDLFIQFYTKLTQRIELEPIFDYWSDNNKLKLMSNTQFMNFINNEQRDPRLHEILHPHITIDKINKLINIYEYNNIYNSNRHFISLNGFINYLMSDDNNIINMKNYDLNEEDMNHPLNHYFINSSHNSYLIGHQLTGRSSIEMYRQCLLAGCRCIELDFWNGKGNEPIIKHGYSLVPEIPAKDVLQAIAESAFKTSKYPVILSFENHCNSRQQAKIAQYCYDIFGDMLLNKPLDTYPLQPGIKLPPPSALVNKIIIKNKKKHHHHHPHVKTSKELMANTTFYVEKKDGTTTNTDDDVATTTDDEIFKKIIDCGFNGSESNELTDDNLSTSDSCTSEEEIEDEDAIESQPTNESYIANITQSDKGTAGKQSEAGAEISALVNYIQPVHFYSFDVATKKNKSFEMSSFDENRAMKLLKEKPKEFVKYNKFQLTRVYPRGTRVDSTNFMPQLFWSAGCQLVALNYQTLDLSMQINLGIFEQNHRAGFLLKPECMRRNDRDFDPFPENTIDGIIAGRLEIKVISGQFLTDKRVGTYIEVEMYGLPVDTVRKKFKTKIVPFNGINPIYDDKPFIFEKIVLPDLAYLRIIAYEESSKIIGHRILPIVRLRQGYRHITLRSESGIPLILPTVFVKIRVEDFVPDNLSRLARALSNPIKYRHSIDLSEFMYCPIEYQNEIEKRAKQLSILQDECMFEKTSKSQNRKIKIKKQYSNPSSPKYTPLMERRSSGNIGPNISRCTWPSPAVVAAISLNLATKAKLNKII